MENLWYLIQVNACITIFYILYVIFFRNLTFFLVNRIYLVVCLLGSFILPLLNFSSVAPDYHLTASDFISSTSFQALQQDTEILLESPLLSVYSIISIIYWLGCISVLLRIVCSVTGLLQLKRRSTTSIHRQAVIVYSDIEEPFSFFNLIFLPKRNVSSLILEHEIAHVKHRHWFDLMIVEIARIVIWFNPVMIWYSQSIKMQHEYEADAFVLNKGAQLEHYLDCLLLHLQANSSTIHISKFYSQTIKQRILMMTKNKSSLRFLLIYAISMPVVCMLLFAFSTPVASSVSFDSSYDHNKDGQVVIIVDAGHGGNDAGSETKGINEKSIVLTLAKQIQQMGEAKNVKVILTRNNDNGLTLEDRVMLTTRHAADAFISLHMNYDNNASTSGIECFVSERNSRFNESKMLAEKVVQQLQSLKGISVTGIKKSDPYILSKNNVPSIILELGYLSNNTDRSFMTDENNQQQVSKSIIDAVVQYTK
ncbi:M56/M15 family metallopeptidase [Chryseolinea sp. H1M3-3]|uniref:M56/M15 family metallopeptidase n=1 Tax=Chryseolinea sp. H1M3-3 TaxID=3034144 RepID=UPI0023EB2C30|nr:M56/M15 family metallopeptidase [Chryseolinea sp. H1M3-3]